jgi:hypothetical protein
MTSNESFAGDALPFENRALRRHKEIWLLTVG